MPGIELLSGYTFDQVEFAITPQTIRRDQQLIQVSDIADYRIDQKSGRFLQTTGWLALTALSFLFTAAKAGQDPSTGQIVFDLILTLLGIRVAVLAIGLAIRPGFIVSVSTADTNLELRLRLDRRECKWVERLLRQAASSSKRV